MITFPHSAAQSVEAAAATAKAAFDEGFRQAQAVADKAYAEFSAASAEQFEKFAQASAKAFDDAQTYARGQTDAAFTAASVLAKGLEGLGRAWFAYHQAVMAQASDVTKQVFAAKSLREVVDLQSQYAKSAFDGAVAEGSKISELGLKVANDAMAPLAARVKATAENIGASAAA